MDYYFFFVCISNSFLFMVDKLFLTIFFINCDAHLSIVTTTLKQSENFENPLELFLFDMFGYDVKPLQTFVVCYLLWYYVVPFGSHRDETN